MEYSKEDLMEAKKQILGVGENMGTEESKKIWEENAQFWDNAMGDESNEFHREVVRPKVTELLSPNPADYILDIACGNGNYSSYLAQRGASVVAFDYSKKMIELAKRRQSQYAKQIEFCVADATDRKSILELKRNRAFKHDLASANRIIANVQSYKTDIILHSASSFFGSSSGTNSIISATSHFSSRQIFANTSVVTFSSFVSLANEEELIPAFFRRSDFFICLSISSFHSLL